MIEAGRWWAGRALGGGGGRLRGRSTETGLWSELGAEAREGLDGVFVVGMRF